MTKTFGLIFPEMMERPWSGVVAGLYEFASDKNFCFLLNASVNGDARVSSNKVLNSFVGECIGRGVSGVLMRPVVDRKTTLRIVAKFRRAGIPVGIIQVGDDLKLKSRGCDVITRNLGKTMKPASERMLGELAFNSLLQRVFDHTTPPGDNRFVAPM